MDNTENTESMESTQYIVEQFERGIMNEYSQVDRFGVYMDGDGYLYLSEMYVKEGSCG